MALKAGPLTDIVLSRARDPNGSANTRQLVWDMFTRLQWAVNAQIEGVVVTTPMPLNQWQCIYGINGMLPNAVKVIGVKDGTRDLYPMGFDQLRGYDRRWARAFSDYLKYFSVLGKDLLIIGPPLSDLSSTQVANVVYYLKTPAIGGDDDTFTIPDEDVQSVMLLTEAILLAKARDWTTAQTALVKAAGQLEIEMEALRE